MDIQAVTETYKKPRHVNLLLIKHFCLHPPKENYQLAYTALFHQKDPSLLFLLALAAFRAFFFLALAAFSASALASFLSSPFSFSLTAGGQSSLFETSTFFL